MGATPFTNETYRTPDAPQGGFVPTTEMPNAGSVIGEGLSKAGDLFGQIGDRIEQQDNLTAVQDAMNKYQAHVRNVQYGDPDNPEQAGYFNLQGKSAMDGWKSAAQDVDQAQQILMQTLNPDQQRMFDQQSRAFQNGALSAMAEHAGRQRQVYQDDVYKDTLTNYANTGAANLDNPEAFAGYLNAGRKAVMQRLALQGVPLDGPVAQAQLQDWNDQYLTTAAKAAADNNDAIKAQNILDSNKGNLSATAYSAASELIRPRVDRQQGDMLAQRVINGGDDPTPIPPDADPEATHTAMVHFESGGSQYGKDGAPLTSTKGAVGVSQLMPDTAREVAQQTGLGWDEDRFRNDANYNRAIGQAYFQQLCQKYGGNQTLACAAYNAGPGNVDKWRQQFGDPMTGAISDHDFVAQIPFKETRNYVSRVGATVTKPDTSPSYSAPDFGRQISDVHAEVTRLGLSPEAEDRALSQVRRNYTDWEQVTATARSALHDHVDDLSSAYMQGNATQPIPEAQIRQLYQPEEADRMIGDLRMRQQAGTEYADLKWASPQQIAQVQKHDQDMLQGADTDHYKTRTQIVSMRDSMIQKRNEALQKDPASFVADNPLVQQAAQQIDPEKPETFQNYAQTVMSVQRNMGVLQPRILTNDQIRQAVQTLTSVDPSKQDVVPVLDGMEKQYGPQLWPQVFGEMVRVGKMPAEYQVLANMDTPGQAAGRQMYAANLKMSLDDLKKAAGLDGKGLSPSTANGDPIADIMSPFMATTQLQDGGVGIDNVVRDAIERQALGYIVRGKKQSEALSDAYDDIIGAKYDTAGTIRAPKGELPAVQSATNYALSRLTPDDIQVSPELDYLPENQRASYTLDRARRLGKWVMNGDESGYNIAMPTRSPGQYRTLMNKDGTPFTVTLKGIRSGQYANPYDSNALKLAQQAQAAYVQQHSGAN